MLIRLWINNTAPQEADKTIDAGVISCTINPAFCMKMLTNELEYGNVANVIDSIIKEEGKNELK